MLQLSPKQKEKITEICRKFGVEILLLFGSQVDGKTHGESDIDLAFAGGKMNFDELTNFNAELQAVFGAIKTETVNIFAASPLLRKKIFDEHFPLYIANRFLYYSLANYALKSYLETKLLRDNLSEYLKKRYAPRR